MSKRTIGFVLIALGVVIALVALTADIIGIGTSPGFNWSQRLGTITGVVVALVGVVLVLIKPGQKK